MKKDLKSRVQGKQTPNTGASKQPSPDQIESFEQMADKYKDKSQNDLMSELMGAVADQKSKGTFSPKMLEDFYKNAAPLLNPDQKKRMRNLIDSINK